MYFGDRCSFPNPPNYPPKGDKLGVAFQNCDKLLVTIDKEKQSVKFATATAVDWQ